MMLKEPICFRCKHFDIEKSMCPAFPDGIPDDILFGNDDHKKPLPDQENNIVFEPIKEEDDGQ